MLRQMGGVSNLKLLIFILSFGNEFYAAINFLV